MRDLSRRRMFPPMEDSKLPIPENEAHKLDAVVHGLQQQPIVRKIDHSVRSQPWPFVLGAFAIGLLCSVGCARR